MSLKAGTLSSEAFVIKPSLSQYFVKSSCIDGKSSASTKSPSFDSFRQMVENMGFVGAISHSVPHWAGLVNDEVRWLLLLLRVNVKADKPNAWRLQARANETICIIVSAAVYLLCNWWTDFPPVCSELVDEIMNEEIRCAVSTLS